MQFTDYTDDTYGYMLHCHNTIHEDHAMLLLWQVAAEGDNNTKP